MNPTIRPIASEEAEAFLLAEGRASGEHYSSDAVRRESSILEPERTLAAFDGDRIAGGAGALTFEMTVPGARQATGGVGWVSVPRGPVGPLMVSSVMPRWGIGVMHV